jgi:hypothetical protein
VSGALKLALTPAVLPPPVAPPNPYPETARALDVLADRVAYNREVAGVHYGMDSAAGAYGAQICLQMLNGLGPNSNFKTLLNAAKQELSDLP